MRGVRKTRGCSSEHVAKVAAFAFVRLYRMPFVKPSEPRVDERAGYQRDPHSAGGIHLRVLWASRETRAERRSERTSRARCRSRSCLRGRRHGSLSRDSVVALGIMGTDLAGTGRTPLAAAAGVAWRGPAARTLMIAAAVVSMFGYRTANMLSEPRGLFAMSRDGFSPPSLTASIRCSERRTSRSARTGSW